MIINFKHESDFTSEDGLSLALDVSAEVESDGFFDVHVSANGHELFWDVLSEHDKKQINSQLEFEVEKYKHGYHDDDDWRTRNRALNEIHAETLKLSRADYK